MLNRRVLVFGTPVLRRRPTSCFRYRVDAVDSGTIALVEYEPPHRSSEDSTLPVPLAESRRILVCDSAYADDVQELCDKWNDENTKIDDSEGEEAN